MLILFGISGCGPSDGGSGAEPPARIGPAPAEGPLVLRLEAPLEVRSGEEVPLRLVLENRGATPVQVDLGGNPIAFDFVIHSRDGSEVWRRLEGMAIEDILHSRVLGAGADLEFRETWRQRGNDGRRVGSGSYRVHGSVPVVAPAGRWETEPRTLTILP